MNKQIKAEDILKPGAKLEARLLTKEEVKQVVVKAEMEQKKVRKLKIVTDEQLNKRITI